MSNQEKMPAAVLGLVTAAALALSGWSLREAYQAKADRTRQEERLGALAERLKGRLDRIEADNEIQIRHTRTLRQHWMLHGWERDQIYMLRQQHDLGIEPWPDLNVPQD